MISHPDLSPTAPSTLESNVKISDRIAAHLNALSKAREAFIQAESSKTIADALKAKVVKRNEVIDVRNWIYFKNLESKLWQGPVTIDNKRIMLSFKGLKMRIMKIYSRITIAFRRRKSLCSIRFSNSYC